MYHNPKQREAYELMNFHIKKFELSEYVRCKVQMRCLESIKVQKVIFRLENRLVFVKDPQPSF
jgi:hypothetical protein